MARNRNRGGRTQESSRARSILQALEPRLLLSNYYVDVNSPGPTHDGLSWETAFTDLQQILPAAPTGSRILVADGTYKPTQDTDRTKSFVLRNGIILDGGYAGASDPDVPRDIFLYETILSGDIGIADDKADNSYNVVNGSETDSSTVLDGFTVTAGNADDNNHWLRGNGGGLYARNSDLNLRNCTFYRNSATNGGGVSVYGQGSPTLLNVTFAGNQATNGGAIYALGQLRITDSVFKDNSASGSGGAIYNNAPDSLILVGCIFQRNKAAWNGGGFYNDSTALLTDCAFVNNIADRGGALSSDSRIRLTNCTITGNTASASGGGLFNDLYASTATLTNSIFVNNRAPTNPEIDSPATALIITYSDIQGGASGVGNLDIDPLFLRNPGPGPDFAWGTSDDDPGDLRLQASSPLADAGTNETSALADVATDLSGHARFQDIPTTPDTGIGTSPLIDIGAYEAMPALSASAGGPYRVIQGQTLILSGLGASTVPGELQYAWEWTGDDQFDDASGPNPTFDTANLPPSIVTVRLRVTDSSQQTIQATSTIRILSPILYIDDSASPGGDGSSWSTALNDLQLALQLSVPGNEIRVAAGTYKPAASSDASAFFQLRNGIALIGGYAGAGAADPDSRDPALTPSVLSGELGDPESAVDNVRYILAGQNLDESAVLDGFTISASASNGTGMNLLSASSTIRNSTFVLNVYAAVSNALSSPRLSNCTFTANGYGIYNRPSSSPTILDCTFANNTSSAISNHQASSPTVTGCTFSRNLAGAISNDIDCDPIITRCTFRDNRSSGAGGAIYNFHSDTTISDCEFIHNSSINGGAIYNDRSRPLIANCTFNENSAEGHGGAIFNWSSSPTISDCTFTSNRAITRNGGAIDNSDSSNSTLTRCTFTANSAYDSGGAIHNFQRSLPTFTDCTFTGNTAQFGGAIDTWENIQLKITNCAFVDNQASQSGGALFVVMFSRAEIAGCTFSGNAARGSSSQDKGNGGAIYYYTPITLYFPDNTLSLTGCTFTSNSASSGGGAIWAGPVRLINCNFTRNSAAGGGGSVYTSGSSKFTTCTFQGNSSNDGCAIYSASTSSLNLVNSSLVGNANLIGNGSAVSIRRPSSGPSSATILNCTFVDNNTPASKGFAIGNDGTTLSLTNSILWSSAFMHVISTAAVIDHSDVKLYRGGTANIDQDPLFLRNPSRGPDAKWGTADDDYGDLRPRHGSPCTDSGDNSAVPPDLATDLAGIPRIGDTPGLRDPGSIVDMGAFEFTPTPATIPGTSADDRFYLRFTASQFLIQIWKSSSAYGNPAYTFDSRSITSLTFANSSGSDAIELAFSGSPFPIPVSFESDVITLNPTTMSTSFTALTIAKRAKLQLRGWFTYSTQQLELLPGASLDLSTNSLVLEGGSYAQATQWIRSARTASPRWSGPGITTSAASPDQGLALAQVGPDVKIKFSWNGDLNLDGRIDADDYFGIDDGFLKKPANPTYQNGDFNFDGKIDADDYFLIDQAFLNQKGVILSSPKPALATTLAMRTPRPSLFSRRKLSHRARRGHRG